MKKIIISLAAASVLLFTGCFIDSDTATVRINLGNIPVAKVEKKSLIDRFLMIFAKEAVAQEVPVSTGVSVVYLGAFDANNQLLAKKSINVTQVEEGPVAINTVVEFDVPARSGVTIVVLGEQVWEGDGSNLFYYGNSIQLVLTAGTTETVEIGMQTFDFLIIEENYFNFRYTSAPETSNAPIAWDRIYGASKIELEYQYVQEPSDYQIIYIGSGISCLNELYEIASGDNYRIKFYFNFAGRDSSVIPFYLWH